jgi:protein subunit release factor A
MIKGLMGSKGVNVQGGNTSLQYVSQNSSNPMQGMVRVWGTDLQVFDGSSWQNIQSSYATVELDAETQTLLQWIRDKQKEEREIETLSQDHPAVRIAKENLNKIKAQMEKAEQQLKATVILSKDYENNAEATS